MRPPRVLCIIRIIIESRGRGGAGALGRVLEAAGYERLVERGRQGGDTPRRLYGFRSTFHKELDLSAENGRCPKSGAADDHEDWTCSRVDIMQGLSELVTVGTDTDITVSPSSTKTRTTYSTPRGKRRGARTVRCR